MIPTEVIIGEYVFRRIGDKFVFGQRHSSLEDAELHILEEDKVRELQAFFLMEDDVAVAPPSLPHVQATSLDPCGWNAEPYRPSSVEELGRRARRVHIEEVCRILKDEIQER